MDILIEYGYREDDVKAFPIEQLARFVILSEGKPDTSEVSITFVDDAEMAEFNARYRGKEGPTDVLSFECDNVDDGFAPPPASRRTSTSSATSSSPSMSPSARRASSRRRSRARSACSSRTASCTCAVRSCGRRRGRDHGSARTRAPHGLGRRGP